MNRARNPATNGEENSVCATSRPAVAPTQRAVTHQYRTNAERTPNRMKRADCHAATRRQRRQRINRSAAAALLKNRVQPVATLSTSTKNAVRSSRSDINRTERYELLAGVNACEQKMPCEGIYRPPPLQFVHPAKIEQDPEAPERRRPRQHD